MPGTTEDREVLAVDRDGLAEEAFVFPPQDRGLAGATGHRLVSGEHFDEPVWYSMSIASYQGAPQDEIVRVARHRGRDRARRDRIGRLRLADVGRLLPRVRRGSRSKTKSSPSLVRERRPDHGDVVAQRHRDAEPHRSRRDQGEARPRRSTDGRRDDRRTRMRQHHSESRRGAPTCRDGDPGTSPGGSSSGGSIRCCSSHTCGSTTSG